jgi:hypothetical protein
VYLDQDGMPTLVEVKRSSDTRLRREVVGQLLDYAANAVAHWPASEIRNRFESRCAEAELDPDEEIERFLDDDELDAAWFWERVKTNLQARKVRMLFAADRIPRELRRIIEFLNEQMDPAEVLGLELKHHAGGGVRVLVPEVIGRTEAASSRKGMESRPSRQWDRETLLEDIEERHGSESRESVAEFLGWCDKLDYEFAYGKGRIDGRCSVFLDKQDGGDITKYPLVHVWTPRATFTIDLTQLGTKAEFSTPEAAERLKSAALQIPGSSLSPGGHTVDIRVAEGDAEAKVAAAKEFVTWLASMIREGADGANADFHGSDDAACTG